jgi:hypothetical protein
LALPSRANALPESDRLVLKITSPPKRCCAIAGAAARTDAARAIEVTILFMVSLPSND